MKRLIPAAVVALAILCGSKSFGAEPRFVKVSDHCYFMQFKDGGENVAAVVTPDGTLLVNPPREPNLSIAVDALKNLTPSPVRWVVFTESGLIRNSGSRVLTDRNPAFLASTRQKALSVTKPGNKPDGPVEPLASSWLVFDRQMRLFPSNLEIRIFALEHKARSGGDLAVFVPAEKVLFVGGLYEAARYPDVDNASEGSAAGWFDGMKDVIDAVPIMKSAIPQEKVGPKLEKDKKPEESITVVSSHGDASNLQNMKDLLDSSKKLRNDIARAIKLGRTCDDFLASPASYPYRSYSNFDAFATQLFTESH